MQKLGAQQNIKGHVVVVKIVGQGGLAPRFSAPDVFVSVAAPWH